ncbi:MAG: tryptophan synthase subunit alpha [Candidatus Omnitrophota bacterium]|nr:tryptophan synthase subunit alpha [Candidatus Omnitrophota bacterium]
MNRIKTTFNKLRKKRKKAFIVYITAGYPALSATERIVPELEKSGVDIVEIGVPFSDPMADGPVIQKSSEKAICNGVTLKKILRSVRNIRKKSDIPIALMSYLNPIYRYGIKKFVADAVKSGVDGVILPDLPPEESGELRRAAKSFDFYVIFLASPTSTPGRIKTIVRHSQGFVYYVSLTGVTGVRDHLAAHISDNIKRIKRFTNKPVCVGFGISNEKQARRLLTVADGVIVGSAVIRVIKKHKKKRAPEKEVGRFTAKLARAVHSS